MSPQPQIFLDVREEGLSAATSHPAFVAVAPEWFYHEGDPRTPFGSDDGHDTLRDLEEWYASGGDDEHAPGRVAALLGDWDLVPEEVWDRDSVGVTAWLDQDESHVRYLHGEVDARVAGALGQFKIIGWIHPALRSWAEEALAMAGLLEVWEGNAFEVEPDEIARRYRAAMAAIVAAAPEPTALSKVSDQPASLSAPARSRTPRLGRQPLAADPIGGAHHLRGTARDEEEPTRTDQFNLGRALRILGSVRTRTRRRWRSAGSRCR